MKASFLVLILFISETAHTAGFSGVTAKGETAKALIPLQRIQTCIENVNGSQELEKCTRKNFASSLSVEKRKALLRWMSFPWDFKNFGPCPKSNMKLNKPAVNSSFYCSDYKEEGLDKRAVFYLHKSGKEWRILNIQP